MNEQICLKNTCRQILIIKLTKMNGWNLQKELMSEYSIPCNRRLIIFFGRYSGADIAVVCREALLRPIRRLGSATHFKRVSYLLIYFTVDYVNKFCIGIKSKG